MGYHVRQITKGVLGGAGTPLPPRDQRWHVGLEPRRAGRRTPSQRDRDRLIYTSALRRLAGVTQVGYQADAVCYGTGCAEAPHEPSFGA